jgi:hypothetical protein
MVRNNDTLSCMSCLLFLGLLAGTVAGEILFADYLKANYCAIDPMNGDKKCTMPVYGPFVFFGIAVFPFVTFFLTCGCLEQIYKKIYGTSFYNSNESPLNEIIQHS